LYLLAKLGGHRAADWPSESAWREGSGSGAADACQWWIGQHHSRRSSRR